MTEWIIVILWNMGALFCVAAAVGLVRFPDILTRMHAATKAPTLGVLLLTLGSALSFGDAVGWIKAAIIVGFLLLTAPVAAHLVGRAALRRRENGNITD